MTAEQNQQQKRQTQQIQAGPARPKSDPGILKDRPLPELAAALRARADAIVRQWLAEAREVVASAEGLPDDELQDHIPEILARLADALEAPAADGADGAAGLIEESPKQGLTRFRQRYDVASLMLEDRLLRRVTIRQIPEALRRPMTPDEQAAINSGLDVMLQRSVIAFVGEQQARLREATEAQLRYLSFLSHDLNNNLSGVTLLLTVLGDRLDRAPGSAEDAGLVHDAQRSIEQTVQGMRQLLEHERLRKSGERPKARPVDLAALAGEVIAQHRAEAARKGVDLRADVEDGATAQTHADVLRIVLQNLVGNAVKYTPTGQVVVAARATDDGGWSISVSDTGPGIPPEHVDRIFDAFRRGETLGQPGTGLGLSIASQAARLLGATLAVESTLGVGTTFRLTLPPPEPELSPRLRETLEYLLAGDSEKQVAARLGISRHTVHLYVTALYRHFGVNSRAELLSKCLRNPGGYAP